MKARLSPRIRPLLLLLALVPGPLACAHRTEPLPQTLHAPAPQPPRPLEKSSPAGSAQLPERQPPEAILWPPGAVTTVPSHPAPQQQPPPSPPAPPSPITAAAASAPRSIDFATHVQPILEARCRPCHFPAGSVYAKLPFDRAATVVQLREKLFTRIKDEGQRRTIREFLAQNAATNPEPNPKGP